MNSGMRLQVKNLSKKYGNSYALRDFSIVFREGVYGILGPNGAGKSTLIHLLTDNLIRTSGEILLDGECIVKMGGKFREKVGYMPQQQGFYDDFTARVFLYYIASLKGIPRKKAKEETDRLLRSVHLEYAAFMKLGHFSGGMRQRILLAQALLGDPDILILDEPTAGLDPKERIHFRNLISSLSKNKIIIFATHFVRDIECVADQVLLLKEGKLIKAGTSAELVDSVKDKIGEKPCTKEDLPNLQAEHPVHNVFQRPTGLMFRIVDDIIPPDFNKVDHDIGLEDVYLYYMESDR